jgi:hypothetical protein
MPKCYRKIVWGKRRLNCSPPERTLGQRRRRRLSELGRRGSRYYKY